MGFNSVYTILREVFPQVDVRMLKAVAIEHSKDADAAVEFILSDVLPSMSNESAPCADEWMNGYMDKFQEQGVLHPKPRPGVEEANVASCSMSGLMPAEGTDISSHDQSGILGDSVLLDEDLPSSSLSKLYGANDYNDYNHNKGYLADSSGCRLEPEINLDQVLHHSLASGGRSPSHDSIADLGHSTGPVAPEFKADSDGTAHLECLGSNDDALSVANLMVMETSSHVHEHVLDASECAGPSEYYSGVTEIEKPKAIISVDSLHEEDNSSGKVINAGEEATLSTLVTRSGQSCRIDLLEDVIQDAKSSKKTLFSAVESIIELMQEVELQEKAAEQAREEALEGGVNILSRVEEMKQMLQHAKGTNDMHAGEVYGEKSILATEARELQGRLLSLSDERDTSLAILNEMRLALEARLAVAAEERQAAEQEKVEKENSAQNALAEQECIMERVVKESKMLQQEAEENSKLREFLIERGRLVDTLQGEIAVICQDVRLLKEKFDERVPLSESVSSSQTSRILASSSSSLKSVASNRVAGQVPTVETPKNRSPISSVCHTAKSSDGERDEDDRGSQGDAGDSVVKGLWEDEWDILDY